ncbi:hypothetical protein [Streptomyces sp. Tu 3180]|uniref:hypothetical protein n=1 Tax=Streptomyces sp. Tu 3180 TaxID=2682611 RepID=UPI00135964C4|nr:hypothetical protein [Streptomyces sp. Tu 3180]KAF3463236.1 hypothetical protein GL259_01685 [Streptomyces sp. Tu 3180]
MLAAAERVRSRVRGEAEIVWHMPVDPASCDGDCDMHDIACGEPGISVPGGNREVPVDLHEPGQRWCTACLNATRQTV